MYCRDSVAVTKECCKSYLKHVLDRKFNVVELKNRSMKLTMHVSLQNECRLGSHTIHWFEMYVSTWKCGDLLHKICVLHIAFGKLNRVLPC